MYEKHCSFRVQPSLSLSLVVEVEAARDLDVQRPEVLKLTPCGWARMDLFDQFNQVYTRLVRTATYGGECANFVAT